MSDSRMKFSASGMFFVAFFALVFAFASSASAQSGECVRDLHGNTLCPPAKTVCLTERPVAVIKCSPPDGGVIADRYGMAQCGVGRCALDLRNDPFCSKVSGGAAARGQYGEVVCTGGCDKAQASLCSVLKR